MADPGAVKGKTTRRRLFKAGIAGGVLALTGSVVAFVRTRGYEVSAERAGKLVAFSPWHFIVFEHIARRIAAPDRDDAPSVDDVDVVGFIDGYVAEMHEDLRRDLLRLLVYVEQLAPIASGFSSRFTRLAPEGQDQVLSALEASRDDLLRGGFDGLKSLVFMGYYRDARTWKILGYEGPLLNRPQGGWTR